MLRRTRTAVTVVAIGLATMAGAAVSASPATAAQQPVAQLRVDEAGYVPGEMQYAVLMTSRRASGARYVIRRAGRIIRTGRVPRSDRGPWNRSYRHTYAIGFTGLRRPGRYRLVVHSVPRVAATIRVRTLASLYRQMLGDGVRFFQVQRDGRHVIAGPLHRRPAHLHDAAATVYRRPHFNPNTDEITDPTLYRVGGPVNVAGGWFDAGDYLKFTHTAAFADVVLLSAERELGRAAPRALVREARYGLTWLTKMWRGRSKTLLLQVGIGNGTSNGRYLGDHDLWRLPQADDHNHARRDRFAAAHRPVFRAAPPGHPISPNLAGRVAAAFALAAQLESRKRAVADYHRAVAILRLANVGSPPHPLTTALPHDFYPESTWRDDMELGTAEAALAAERLHRPYQRWLARSARFARGYFRHGRGDTFNLYDVSALAHAELIRAMRGHRDDTLAVSRKALVGDIARQLRGAARAARRDPFFAAGNVDEFDVDSHTFGIIATAGWYHRITGKGTFDRLASEERDWLFGANAWGMSFMVGVGTKYPDCMQHQVANLSGSRDGSPPIDVGAVVNGPNSAKLFAGGLGGFQDGMRHCVVHGLRRFDGHGSRYLDDVRSWQTDEPALDMTGTAIAAAAAQLTRR